MPPLPNPPNADLYVDLHAGFMPVSTSVSMPISTTLTFMPPRLSQPHHQPHHHAHLKETDCIFVSMRKKQRERDWNVTIGTERGAKKTKRNQTPVSNVDLRAGLHADLNRTTMLISNTQVRTKAPLL